jgi:hypothetical protein
MPRPEKMLVWRMDHAEEIGVEYMSPNFPRQNGQVERNFVTLRGCFRAILDVAGLEKDLRNELWAKSVIIARKLCKLISKLKKSVRISYNLMNLQNMRRTLESWRSWY